MDYAFRKAAACQIADKDFTAARGRVCIATWNEPDWRDWWRKTIGIQPLEFYAMLTRDLPGQTMVFMTPNGGVQGEYTTSTILDGQEIMYARRVIDRDRWLEFDETEIKDSSCHRKGLGRIWFENHLDLAKAMNIPKICLRAGRDDGAYFWSRRGGVLDTTPDSLPYQRFVETVTDNLTGLPNIYRAPVEAILAKPSPDINVRIARIEGEVNGMPAGKRLLTFTYPNLAFNLTDAAQMQKVQQFLGDMAATRRALPALFDQRAEYQMGRNGPIVV